MFITLLKLIILYMDLKRDRWELAEISDFQKENVWSTHRYPNQWLKDDYYDKLQIHFQRPDIVGEITDKKDSYGCVNKDLN